MNSLSPVLGGEGWGEGRSVKDCSFALRLSIAVILIHTPTRFVRFGKLRLLGVLSCIRHPKELSALSSWASESDISPRREYQDDR